MKINPRNSKKHGGRMISKRRERKKDLGMFLLFEVTKGERKEVRESLEKTLH
jgi:hypothetical protein